MKNTKIFIILFIIFVTSSYCGKKALKDKVIGKWKIETISGKTIKELPENQRKIAPTSVEFSEKEIKMIMGALSLTASYSVFGEESAILSLKVKVEDSPEQILTVIFFSDDKITIKDKELDMTAVRIKE